jgi:TolB-like protein/Flp pilus assembly protein TadD
MSAETSPNSKLEVAHVLFIGVAGFSELRSDEQGSVIARLKDLVQTTRQFRAAAAVDEVVFLPTEDGLALAFFHRPAAPVECAVAIAKTSRANPKMHLRIGIHSGPVEVLTEPDGRRNIAGAGMNVAQHLMTCANARQILLSKRVAEDLEQYSQWRSHLHLIGELELNDGRKIPAVNLYSDDFGNAQPPDCVKDSVPAISGTAVMEKPARKRRTLVYALLLIPVAVGTALSIHRFEREPKPPAEGPAVPDKSIAVLPFDNFSDDNQNAYFADGVQDDILTSLAKVSDLKVISRSSVMQYRGRTKNLREIGQSLGVAYVLEGSVRRYADKIRITAQLIDARTDIHTWAEYYDRALSDVFAIQSEVAEKIAAELKANISPSEHAAIQSQPTQDLIAFDAYLQARQLFYNFHDSPDWKKTLLKSLHFVDQALARDKNFALGYCLAAQAHDALYWYGIDRTPARLANAKAMAAQALALAPSLGEAHLVQALIHYHGSRDYARAREELAIAQRTLPNSAEMYSLNGWIDRRQGRWTDAIKNEEKAVELDPRNSQFLNSLSILYDILRRYDDEEAVFARAIAANPASADYFNLLRAQVELERGDTKGARERLNALPGNYDPDGATTTTRINLALYENDAAAGAKILGATKLDELVASNGLLLPRAWFEGVVARAQNDSDSMQNAFASARTKIEAKLQQTPDDAALLGFLGLIDAALDRKSEAVAEGLRAGALRPLGQDAVDGASIITLLALIYTWIGDTNSAIQQLNISATIPGGVDYGQLKYDPAWSGLRADSRYATILEQLRMNSGQPHEFATR